MTDKTTSSLMQLVTQSLQERVKWMLNIIIITSSVLPRAAELQHAAKSLNKTFLRLDKQEATSFSGVFSASCLPVDQNNSRFASFFWYFGASCFRP